MNEEMTRLLYAWATLNKESKNKNFNQQRGINSKTKGINLDLVYCASVSVPTYVFDKLLDRIYLNGECIEFNGAGSNGYTHFHFNGRNQLTHRISYQVFVGIIPDDLVIDHICRNRKCINPKHLRAITNKENILCGVGASAIHAKKTHCMRGHEFTHENTYRHKFGRACRICKQASKKAYDEKIRNKPLFPRNQE